MNNQARLLDAVLGLGRAGSFNLPKRATDSGGPGDRSDACQQSELQKTHLKGADANNSRIPLPVILQRCGERDVWQTLKYAVTKTRYVATGGIGVEPAAAW